MEVVGVASNDREHHIRQLRAVLHADIEVVHERGTVIEGPGGTQLVNGRTHDVECWIDRRSKWGNPFKTVEDGGDYERHESVDLYRGWLLGHLERGEWGLEELRGQQLGCWCLPKMCHGVVVLNALAGTYDPQQTLDVVAGGDDRGE